MTVSVTSTVNSSVGNGVTTVFPYAFRILAAADLEVSVDGVVKALGVDYTVSGVGSGSGGNVTFVVAPATGAKVIRRRDMALVRTTDYQDNGDLLADVLNPDQDAPVMMMQQVQEQVDRSVKFPLGEAADPTLPSATARAGKGLGFDSSGDIIMVPQVGDLAEEVADAAASAAAALASQTAAATNASTSGTNATSAATAKTAAQLAQAQAEAARDAAQASGRIFANTTAGLAGTTSGQYFWIVSASNPAVLDLYLNSAGTAVSQSKSIPSTAILSSDSTISNALEVWLDSTGTRGMEFDSKGRLAVRDALFGNARSLSDLASTVDTDGSLLRTFIGLENRKLDALRAESQGAMAAESDIFNFATDGGPNYRLPVVLRTGASTFLVFVQQQNSTSDFSNINIKCRSVTVNSDGTFTLGAVKTVATADGTHQYGLGSAIQLANGNIVLFCYYATSDQVTFVPMKFTSTDGGATWSAGTSLASSFPGLGTTFTGDGSTVNFTLAFHVVIAGQIVVTVNGVTKTLNTDYTVTNLDSAAPVVHFLAAPAGGAVISVVGWRALVFGPAKAIKLRKGPYAGRIIIPFWHSRLTFPSGTNDIHAGFLYSDDETATIRIGAITWLGTANESSVVEDVDGNVLLISRRDQTPGRWVSLSKTGGQQINECWQIDQNVINAPVCEASATQCDNDFDASPGKIAYFGPRPTTAADGTAGNGRDHGTVFLSYDQGRTFPYRYQVTSGGTAYTAIEACGAGRLLCIREFDNNLQRITAVVVTMKNILGSNP